ncbi:MAG: DUF2190 family protein [Puniceicoccales bacterium]|jgi:hypothetical protein|nr:DUF2190 family protein [Puniceicoccales bacterium]
MKQKIITVANVAEGTHDGNITYATLLPIHTTNRLVSFEDGKVKISTIGQLPFGIITDETDAAGDFANVCLLGGKETAILVADGPIEQGSCVYGSRDGKISTLSSESGTYYLVGIALQSATDGDKVEVLTTFPAPTIVDDLENISR